MALRGKKKKQSQITSYSSWGDGGDEWKGKHLIFPLGFTKRSRKVLLPDIFNKT